MDKTDSIILMYHKGLHENNGTSIYLNNMLKALSKNFNVIVPSESFFKKRIGKTNKWIAKAIGVNLYLIGWVLLNSVRKRNKFKIIIAEDRYVVIPTILLKFVSSAKLIIRVSDWGKKYIDTIPINKLIKTFLSLYSSLFHFIAIKIASSIIVPSENMKEEIAHKFKGNIFILPYMAKELEIYKGNNPTYPDANVIKNEICAIFVGDCRYPPNFNSAVFLTSEVAPKLQRLDDSIRILIAGPGSNRFFGNLSNNVTVLGEIDDLGSVFAKCHIGINPSVTFGGTSIKNIEYLLNGLLVITTSESSIGVINTSRLIISKREDFAQTIYALATQLRAGLNVSSDEEEISRIREYYSSDRNSQLLINFVSAIA